ncbi:N-acetyltransferase [Shewanella sp. VB17]|nr:GNAT family N-acetyltransferase [Shewanella sp. VB17]NRD71779.1 N-acetyltransferase [Shewanella sp. VB17]
MTDTPVLHQHTSHQFIININQKQAILVYEIDDDQINFTRTFVPDELRGRGLAEKLVHHGLHWAKEQDYKIEASCWYVKKFLSLL